MDEKTPPVYPSSPPLISPGPIARRSRSGRGWKVLALVLLAVLALIFATDIFRFLEDFTGKSGSARRSTHGLQEILVEDNNSRNKILVVDIEGIITGALIDGYNRNLVSLIKDELKAATDDDAVKAVVLKVDSPGGEVMASDQINQAIADFQKESHKPVVAAMGGLAASGGYYVSAPCQWIVANELTLTGSIGVIMHGFNYRALMDKVGVRPEIYKSGKFKDMLSGDKSEAEISPEERRMVQALIDQAFAKFKDVVFKGREWAESKNQGKGRSLADNWTQYADGRILSGKEAYQYGFVDELGDFDAAVDQAKKLASNIPDANLVRYQQPFDVMSVLKRFVKADPPSLRVDWGFQLPKIQAGRLYFLAPTLWH